MNGISVIIPTYNNEKYIAQAVNSVLEQDYAGKIEVIVSDDGSKDNTLEVLKQFGCKIIIIEKPHDCISQGPGPARNRGLSYASQPYICFLDSDDCYLPYHLSNLSKVLDSNENCGFGFCRMLIFNENSNLGLYRAWTRLKITKNDIKNPVISNNNVVNTGILFFKKCVFEKVGVFNELYKYGEDGDMWMRISELYSGIFADYYGMIHRKHENSFSSNHNRGVFKCYFSEVFKDARQRYYDLGMDDKYRIMKLNLLIWKYKILYLKPFHVLYGIYKRIQKRKQLNLRNWHSLAYFLKENEFYSSENS